MMVRGVERRKVCYDDNDRDNFLDRLMESWRPLLDDWSMKRDRVEMGSNLNSNKTYLMIFQQA